MAADLAAAAKNPDDLLLVMQNCGPGDAALVEKIRLLRAQLLERNRWERTFLVTIAVLPFCYRQYLTKTFIPSALLLPQAGLASFSKFFSNLSEIVMFVFIIFFFLPKICIWTTERVVKTKWRFDGFPAAWRYAGRRQTIWALLTNSRWWRVASRTLRFRNCRTRKSKRIPKVRKSFFAWLLFAPWVVTQLAQTTSSTPPSTENIHSGRRFS